MRRKFRYNAETREVEEVGLELRSADPQHYIQPDIQEFVSPVDGTVIKSRQHLRRYMKANNLAHYDDFGGTRDARVAEREKYHQGKDRKSVEQRVEKLRDSFEQVRNNERARQRYG